MSKKSKTPRRAAHIQQMLTCQYLIFLLLLTFLNISFFFVLRSSIISISNKGQTALNGLLPSPCSNFSEESEKEHKTSVHQLLSQCDHARNTEKKVAKNEPLLTMFTTFADHLHTDSEKIIVHNNTLVNWASLKPSVNLILFSNDIHWTTAARSFGWDVVKSLTENNETKPPTLKDMFRLAMDRYKTKWYGYVNADILFTRDIILNLEILTRIYNNSNTRILLTGRRTNVDNLTDLNPQSENSVKKHAKKYGRLYKTDAEDFFITTNSFPWQRILPVVVGRPGYDNWLVGEARCRLNTTVIDVTQTLLAFHQTTRKGGNSEGHHYKDSDYNLNVLKKNKIVPSFLAGLTDCIILYTYRTFCDTLDVATRTHYAPKCDCESLLS